MCFEMRRALLELWERLWESDGNIAAVGMNSGGRDRAKGAPTESGWVLLCGGLLLLGVSYVRSVGLLTS